jgi:mannose-6-phosphate isomerase
MILCPLRLEPTFSPRPWGSLSLAPFFPEKSNLTEPIGEAWMTGSESRLANGPFRGKSVGEAWIGMSSDWRGTLLGGAALFPLLVKFLFTEDKPSVQVHPDDDYASKHESRAGGRGKTEMWYILRARPGGEVLIGLKPGVTREGFKRAIRDGTAEDYLDHIPLHAGEAVFIPAGTAHTIGAGLVLCEIQENSDLTYRVYDYNRPDAHGRMRPLHIEKALEVIRFGEQSGGKLKPARIERGAVTITYFVACRHFATEKWEFSEPVAGCSSPGHFDLAIFLEGAGTIRWGKEQAEYGPAQAWMIPAALGPYQLAPCSRTSMLRTYVPGDLDDLGRRLAERGLSESAWSRIVYP